MNDNSHSDSSGFATGFLLGLMVGGAGGYLLSTEKGQELVASLKEQGGEKLKSLTDNTELGDKLAELEETMQKAKSILEEGKSSAKAGIHEAATTVAEKTANGKSSKKNFFQKHGLTLGK